MYNDKLVGVIRGADDKSSYFQPLSSCYDFIAPFLAGSTSLATESVQPAQSDTQEVPFTNRQEIIVHFEKHLDKLEITSDAKYILNAPKGYGKSRLLKELLKLYIQKGWMYASIKIQAGATLDEFTCILNQDSKSPHTHTHTHKPDTDNASFGDFVGSLLEQQMSDNKGAFSKGLVIVLDIEGTLHDDLGKYLLLDFIKDILGVVDDTPQRDSKTFRLDMLFAGRYLGHEGQITGKHPSFEYLALPSLSIDDIRDSYSAFTKKLGHQEIQHMASFALCLGAGNPACMSHIFHARKDAQDYGSVKKYIAKNYMPTWESFVSSYATEAYKQMECITNNAGIYHLLSMFRYVDDLILAQIVQQFKGEIEFSDRFDFGDKMQLTGIFRKSNGIFHGNIFRRLVTLQLYHSNKQTFNNCSDIAQVFCREQIISSELTTDLNNWVLEYLFQCLQKRTRAGWCSVHETTFNTKSLYLKFMDTDVEKAIEYLKESHIQNNRDLAFQRSKKEMLLNTLMDDTKQWELRFSIDHYLPEGALNNLKQKLEEKL